ncbi:hypothetical protein M0R45_028840 [Rubus argutus]|uniref:Secreted protein n=1 Tax=Rubus argutus TaxID=59490 RepID=A0AAW1WAH8_RUBAR
MCPLRFILIFLSATLAGFFFLRNMASDDDPENCTHSTGLQELDASSSSSPSFSSKLASTMRSGFWTCVDMSSGRYLWRTLGRLLLPSILSLANFSDWFFCRSSKSLIDFANFVFRLTSPSKL